MRRVRFVRALARVALFLLVGSIVAAFLYAASSAAFSAAAFVTAR